MGKRGFAPVAILVLLLMVAGLGLAVTRVTDLKNVFQKPRASGIQATDGVYVENSFTDNLKVKFTVAGNGQLVQTFYFITPTCDNSNHGFVNYTDSFVQDAPITGGHFSASKWGTSIDGTFDSPTSVTVNISITSNNVPGCSDLFTPKSFSRHLSLPVGRGKSCMVSLDRNLMGIRQAVKITSSSTGGKATNYVSRTDTDKILGLGDQVYTDSAGHNYYVIPGSSLAGLKEGNYKIFCTISEDPGKCSGNPFCNYNGGSVTKDCDGWKSCGSSDHADLTVTSKELKTCTISATVNGQVINFTSSGTGGSVLNYVSRTDTKDISGLGNPTFTDSKGRKYYLMAGANYLSGLAAGEYKLWCGVGSYADVGRCSGNPFASYKHGDLPQSEDYGYVSCSASDNTAATVVAVPTCTGAPCTGEGRERVYTGGGAWHWEPADCKANNNEADCKNVDRCSWNSACSNPGGGPTGGGGSCNPGQTQNYDNGSYCRTCDADGHWPAGSSCSGGPQRKCCPDGTRCTADGSTPICGSASCTKKCGYDGSVIPCSQSCPTPPPPAKWCNPACSQICSTDGSRPSCPQEGQCSPPGKMVVCSTCPAGSLFSQTEKFCLDNHTWGPCSQCYRASAPASGDGGAGTVFEGGR